MQQVDAVYGPLSGPDEGNHTQWGRTRQNTKTQRPAEKRGKRKMPPSKPLASAVPNSLINPR